MNKHTHWKFNRPNWEKDQFEFICSSYEEAREKLHEILKKLNKELGYRDDAYVKPSCRECLGNCFIPSQEVVNHYHQDSIDDSSPYEAAFFNH